jgi:hypothetical protein
MNSFLKQLLPPIDFGWNGVRARCGLTACHHKLLMRPTPQCRSGIRMGETWYCSVDCFVSAVRSPLAALSMSRIVEMPRNPRLTLGLALLAKGFVSEEELRLATEYSQNWNEPVEDTLLRIGLVTERHIAAARAAQWGHPFLGHENDGKPVEADLPLTILRAFSAVPLHYAPSAKRMVLGFVERVHHSLLQSIEQVTGCRAEACFVTSADYADQMRRLTAPGNYEEVVLDEFLRPDQMARSLGGLALDAAAREATFTQCKGRIWARLTGKTRTIDVLFPVQSPAQAAKAAMNPLVHETAVTLA